MPSHGPAVGRSMAAERPGPLASMAGGQAANRADSPVATTLRETLMKRLISLSLLLLLAGPALSAGDAGTPGPGGAGESIGNAAGDSGAGPESGSATGLVGGQGAAIVAAIEQGERLFALRADDGYWYPVGLTSSRILESLPAQVEVLRLFDGSSSTVKVTRLHRLRPGWLEAARVERYLDGKWQGPLQVMAINGGLAAPIGSQPPLWRRLSLGALRFRADQSRSEGENQ